MRNRIPPVSLVVLIPAGGHAAQQLVPGSMAVARRDAWRAGAPTRIYYEGGLYDPKMTPREKVMLAAGRLAMKYPTIAFIGTTTAEDKNEWTEVGTAEYHPLEITLSEDPAALAALVAYGVQPESLMEGHAGLEPVGP